MNTQNIVKKEAELSANYLLHCEVCDQVPTVTIREMDGSLFTESNLCGSCFFGESECSDPSEWVSK